MALSELLDLAHADIRAHCAAKGYVSGPHWNPLVPQDSVAALGMARWLLESGRFDDYIAVAPEGHVYGYFFERLGARLLSVFVEYPPKCIQLVDDLTAIRDRSVLLIEDDVVSGVSLELVVRELARFAPRSLSLYLGRDRDSHQFENIPAPIGNVYLAEDCLDPADRGRHEREFVELFSRSSSVIE
jgi:hypothetical protein